MTQDFIFAQDVILDPDTGKSVAVVRNGEVFRDGARIAVLVGAHMYDLNGNLVGQLAAGAGSLPVCFKNLLEGKSALSPLRQSRSYAPPAALRTPSPRTYRWLRRCPRRRRHASAPGSSARDRPRAGPSGRKTVSAIDGDHREVSCSVTDGSIVGNVRTNVRRPPPRCSRIFRRPRPQ